MGRIKLGAGGVVLALLVPAWAEDQLEQPVGLVMASHDAQLLRSGTNLPLGASPGDVLFAGDSLWSGAGASAVFLFCPTGSSQQLLESSEIEFENGRVRIRKGGLANPAPAPICSLPMLERVSAAAQKHYGVSMDPAVTISNGPIGSLEPHLELLPEDRRSAVAGELARIDRAIHANPEDLAAQVARAVLLEKSGLNQDAADQYKAIGQRWPDAVWAGARAFVNEEQSRGIVTAPRSRRTARGKTYALIVGVSSFRNPSVTGLRFAHADAELFEQHLRSPRGGALTGSAITVLTNEKATLAAVQNAINELLKLKAGKDDTVVLFFASHGISVGDDGYILTTDSDPQDLRDTALPMSVVQSLFLEKLHAVGHVVLYVDVCHAARIASIRDSNQLTDIVSTMADEDDFFGILASRKNQAAYEGPQWGGHGVFSLYLVEALNGAAKAQNGVIDAGSVADYVQSQVYMATQHRQRPLEIGNAYDTILADLDKGGLDMAKILGPMLTASLESTGRRGGGLPDAIGPGEQADDLKNFEEALRAGRLLPNTDRSAFVYLPALQSSLPRSEYLAEENRLRVELEDKGQQILLTYLKGEEVPQVRDDFRSGASLSEAAQRLTPESLLLRARRDFFAGRTALFDKEYARGIPLLERAARTDSAAAYPYNALGIAYLASANYSYAVWAFRDAIKRAPYWAYPRYNLALTLADSGDYAGAEREYRDAIRLAPGYFYVHYGLGVLLHNLGRQSEAEREYQRAIDANPKRPEPYVGLGAVEAFFGRRSKAEENYQAAIRLDSSLAAAAHDLGLLYAQEKKQELAIQTWTENIARNPDFIPSRMSLATTYRDLQRYEPAIDQYQAVLSRSPAYAAAAMALSETEGDRHQREHQFDRARQDYREALGIAVGDDDRKRIQRKLRKLP